MKIIDFVQKGNQVRFYVGNDNCNNYWGDDWDDKPYEHNAGSVYSEFIVGYFDKSFDFDDIVMEPCCGYSNSNWSKEDMMKRSVPCIAVLPKQYQDKNTWYYYFSDIVNNENAILYYFGDKVDETIENIHYVREYESNPIYALVECPFEMSEKLFNITLQMFATSFKYVASDKYAKRLDDEMIPTISKLSNKPLRAYFVDLLKENNKIYHFENDIKSLSENISVSLVNKKNTYKKGVHCYSKYVCILSKDVFDIGSII